MNIPNIPRLDEDSWEINGNSMTAWINDLELYEISPAGMGNFRLSINHVAHAQSVLLGIYPSINAAQLNARRHLGDEGGMS